MFSVAPFVKMTAQADQALRDTIQESERLARLAKPGAA